MAHDPKYTTSSVNNGGIVMAWACMAAPRTVSHVFINDVTINGLPVPFYITYYPK